MELLQGARNKTELAVIKKKLQSFRLLRQQMSILQIKTKLGFNELLNVVEQLDTFSPILSFNIKQNLIWSQYNIPKSAPICNHILAKPHFPYTINLTPSACFHS
jgi:hypothetical protein